MEMYKRNVNAKRYIATVNKRKQTTMKETIKHISLMILVILTGYIPQLSTIEGYGLIILMLIIGLCIHLSCKLEDIKC